MATVWFEGIDELNTVTAAFTSAAGNIGAKGAQVVRKSTFAVEGTAKLFCPVDTGHLKGSIGPPVFHGSAAEVGGFLEGEVTAHANYSIYVEGGTRNMAPQAFMGPALDIHTPGFIEAAAAIADIDLRGSL